MGTFELPLGEPSEFSTRGIVMDRFALSEDYAAQTFAAALGYLSQFESVNVALDWSPPANISLVSPTGLSGLSAETPTSPAINAVTVANVDFAYPAPQSTGYEITALAIPDFAVTMPNFFIPAAPTTRVPQFLYDAPVGSDITIPTDNIPALPPLPILREILPPDEPTFNLPEFAATMPVADLTPPALSYVWNEAAYDSELKNTLIQKILDGIINGGTGLLPEVEQAIYDRAGTRLDNELQKNELLALNDFASRGSRLPQGALVARLDNIRFEALLLRGDLTRDVLIKSADLAYQYSTFIIDKGLSLEQSYMTLFNNIQQRAFEASKVLVEFAIKEFEIRVEAFKARLEGYRTEAEIFKARLQAEIARAELYKATIEGRKLSVEMQGLMVDLYGKQIGAIEVMAQIFSTKMSAAKIQAEIDGLQVERFKALIEAYKAQVDGVSAEYGLYTSQIAGESEKAKMYSYQVEGYGKVVDAYKTRSDIDVSIMQAHIEQSKGEVSIFTAMIDKYKADIQNAATQAEIQAQAEGLKIQAFDGEVKKFSAIVSAIVEAYKSETTAATANADVQVRYGDMLARIETAQAQIQAELIKAKAMIASQLSSASLSSVSAGASLGFTESDGKSRQQSESSSYDRTKGTETISTSHDHKYAEKCCGD